MFIPVIFIRAKLFPNHKKNSDCVNEVHQPFKSSLRILKICIVAHLYVLDIISSLKRLKQNSHKRMQEAIIRSILNVLNIGLLVRIQYITINNIILVNRTIYQVGS